MPPGRPSATIARTPAELLTALEAGALDVLQPDVMLSVGMLRPRILGWACGKSRAELALTVPAAPGLGAQIDHEAVTHYARTT